MRTVLYYLYVYRITVIVIDILMRTAPPRSLTIIRHEVVKGVYAYRLSVPIVITQFSAFTRQGLVGWKESWVFGCSREVNDRQCTRFVVLVAIGLYTMLHWRRETGPQCWIYIGTETDQERQFLISYQRVSLHQAQLLFESFVG